MGDIVSIQITATEEEVCNLLDPPRLPVNRGGGRHVTIPSDWESRVAAGERVPGVFYYRRDPESNEIDATERLRAAIDDPTALGRVPGRLTAALATVDAKIRAAIPEGAQGASAPRRNR